jgi:hypothetical protein
VESAAGPRATLWLHRNFQMWCGYLRHFANSSTIVRVSFPECCCAGLRIFSPVHAVHGALSFSPEIPKTHRRQFRVANRMLNVAMAEISLQGSGVMPFVGQCVAAGVPEHMWMSLEPQTCFSASPPNHACEPCGAEGCSSLRREHEWRLRLLLTLKAPQGS